MIERVQLDILRGHHGLAGALLRYGILERLASTCERAGLTLLAFGFGGDELRMVVEGDTERVPNMVRGLKVGTTRAAQKWNLEVQWAPMVRLDVEPAELAAAVAWAHRAPVDAGATGPLASPWSSHRDLMGFREADFYDDRVVCGRVDPREVHALAGGRPLPEGWPPEDRADRESLAFLLRMAAATKGVLPADRRCFRLFVHLANARGWSTMHLAEALTLTRRRIRQLHAEDEPLLDTALVALGDPRLRCVP